MQRDGGRERPRLAFDGDGASDLCDPRPDDPNKTLPGACGCGQTDVDTDGDGVGDACTPPPEGQNLDTCGSCGAGSAALMALMAMMMFSLRRRLRRRARGQ